MAIGDLTNLPVALANAIQQGMLAREYKDALRSILAYAREADEIKIPANIGSTYTFTKLSELLASRLPLDPTQMSNIDNGLTSDQMNDEQYTFKLSRYAKTYDVNLQEQKAIIKSYVLNVIAKQGRQAARVREAVCRYKLTNAYMAGNTMVTNHMTPTNTQCHIDDIRGFQNVMVNGTVSNVSASTGFQLAVTDLSNSGVAVLQVTAVNPDSVSATPETDAANLSSAKSSGGISGVITYTSLGAGTLPAAGDLLQTANASVIQRPNGKSSTQALGIGDLFNSSLVMGGRTTLQNRGVEPYDDGYYRCICPPASMSQLFSDPDFKLAAAGQLNSPEMRFGQIVRFQGIEYVTTTEALVQAKGAGIAGGPSAVGVNVVRPILLGKGAITRGDSEGLEEFAKDKQDRSVTHDSNFIDGIEFIVRSPVDRLGEQLSMSWQGIYDYCTPTDATSTAAYIPTTDNALYKKAVQFEHVV